MTRFGIQALQERVKAAVEAEGIRPFARRAGVGVGVVRSMLDGRDPNYSSAEALAIALNLDLGFGPVLSLPEPPEPPTNAFAQIPLHNASLGAGDGRVNHTEEVTDYLAFRRDWLRKIGVAPSNAVLARADGDSMQPTIWAGDMVLIDRSRTEIPVRKPNTARTRSPIYAVLDDGRARLKRIERPEDGQLILISDNPDFPPQVSRADEIAIIGKVLWWGHTNRE